VNSPLATDGARFAVGWTQDVSGNQEIYVREYSGGLWAQLANSASGAASARMRAPARAPASPTLAVRSLPLGRISPAAIPDLFQKVCGGVWSEAGAGAASGAALSGTVGSAIQPSWRATRPRCMSFGLMTLWETRPATLPTCLPESEWLGVRRSASRRVELPGNSRDGLGSAAFVGGHHRWFGSSHGRLERCW